MDIKNFSQAMALQKELSAKLVTNVEKLRSKKAPSVAATIKEQERLIAQAKAELVVSEKEKEHVVKRWDLRVQQRKATVERLEKSLKEMKKKVAELEKVRKKAMPVSKSKKVVTSKKKVVAKPRVQTAGTKKKS